MNGLREQFEIDEQAEAIRDRIVHWEHQRPTACDEPADDVAQLQGLLNEMHQVEEDRRTSQHLAS